MQVFCPLESTDRVREAIGNAGGGRIGNYTHCISEIRSRGYFKPGATAKPAFGTVGMLSCVEEAKLEWVCDEAEVEPIMSAIKNVHPYEEVAYDIIPLLEMDRKPDAP